jgi:hypothetical protein
MSFFSEYTFRVGASKEMYLSASDFDPTQQEKYLHIEWLYLRDFDTLAGIEVFRNLKCLILHKPLHSIEGITDLSQLTYLKIDVTAALLPTCLQLTALKTLEFLEIRLVDVELPLEFWSKLSVRYLKIDTTQEVLPDVFDKMPELETFESIKPCPPSVIKVKTLQRLATVVDTRLFPDDMFGGVANLTHLLISYLNFRPAIFESICTLTQLQLLKLVPGRRVAKLVIPEAIRNLTHLKKLILFGNRGIDITHLDKISNTLELLDLQYCEIVHLPESISHFTKLKELNLESNRLTDLPVGLALLSHLEKLRLEKNPVQTSEAKFGGAALALFQVLHKNNLSSRQCRLAWALFMGIGSEIESATVEEIFDLLPVPNSVLQRNIFIWLEKRLPNPFLQPAFDASQCEVLVIGKKMRSYTPTEIAEQMRDSNLAVAVFGGDKAGRKAFENSIAEKDKTPGRCVVLVGEGVVWEQLTCINECKLPVALPIHWQSYKDSLLTPYLKEADDATTQNLLRLLASQTPENINVANTLLAYGGLPNELVYPVFLIALINPQIQKTFEKLGSVAMVALLKRNLSRYPASQMHDFLQSKATDPYKLVDAVHWFYENEPNKAQKINTYTNDWPVNIYKACLQTCFERNDALAHYVFQKQLAGNNLNLQYAAIRTLPSDLSAYTSITQVNIAVQTYLSTPYKKIPSCLISLPSLKQVSVWLGGTIDKDLENRIQSRKDSFQQALPGVRLDFVKE